MKAIKVAAIVLGALVVLVALLVGVALMPAFQTWAAKRVLAGQPGLSLQVGRVAAGPSAVDLSTVRYETGGVVVAVKSVHVAYSAWDYLRNHRLSVADVEVQGVEADLRHPTPAAPTARAVAARQKSENPLGALVAPVRLPLGVQLGKLAVDGRVLLPAGRSATFSLEGGGLGTGKSGKIGWRCDFKDPAGKAPLESARAQGTLEVAITSDGLVSGVGLDAEAAAKGPSIPADRLRIHLAAAEPSEKAAKTMSAAIALVHDGRAARLLALDTNWAPGALVTGHWSLTAAPQLTEAYLAAFGLPRTALDGSGDFSISPETAEVRASGALSAGLADLERLSPALAGVGSVRVATEFDAGFGGSLATIDKLRLRGIDQAGRDFFDVETLQKVSYDTNAGKVTFSDPQADLARISVESLPLAWAQPLLKGVAVQGGNLSMAFAVAADPDGSRVRLRAAEPVSLRGLTLRQRDRTLLDRLQLTMSPEADYASDRATFKCDDIAISVAAGDRLDAAVSVEATGLKGAPRIAFAVDTRTKLVQALRPYLAFDPGPVATVTHAEGSFEGGRLAISKAGETVTRLQQDSPLLASFELLQPVTVQAAAASITPAHPADPVLRISLGRFPLAWAQPFVAAGRLSGDFAGGSLEIGLPAKDQATIRSIGPLSVSSFGAELNGSPMARDLDLEAEFTASRNGRSVSADFSRFEIKQGTTSLLRAAVKADAVLGGSLQASASGTIEADLAGLSKQPAAGMRLAQGRLDAQFQADLGPSIGIRAKLALRNLVAESGNRPLGDLDLKATADLGADGKGSLDLPLTLKVADRTSDLSVNGRFSRTPSLLSFDGKVLSRRLFAQDFQALAALSPSASAQASSPAAPAVQASPPSGSSPAPQAASPATASLSLKDTQPFWHGFGGRILVDLKSLQVTPEYLVSDIAGSLSADERHIGIDSFQGNFKENAFKVSAGISFDASKDRPYSLLSAVNVPGFDLGAFLRAADPADPPAIETKLTIGARLQGTGLNVADLAQNVYGTFDASGSKGVLRALGKKGRFVSAASSVLGILGAIQGSDTTAAVGQVAGELNEMQFDRFQARIERGSDLNVKLTSLEFLSPDKHLTGTGTITYRAGVPLPDQSLHVDLLLAAKAPLAVPLNRLGLLTSDQDGQGYYKMSPGFTIGGTLAKPDSSQLWQILEKAAANAAVSGLGRLLQR